MSSFRAPCYLPILLSLADRTCTIVSTSTRLSQTLRACSSSKSDPVRTASLAPDPFVLFTVNLFSSPRALDAGEDCKADKMVDGGGGAEKQTYPECTCNDMTPSQITLRISTSDSVIHWVGVL